MSIPRKEIDMRRFLKSNTLCMFFLLSFISIFLLTTLVSANQIWPSDEGAMFKDFFGEDEIVYVPGDLDMTSEDFILPTARIYVIRDGSTELTDVTHGGYNVIVGTLLGGGFIGEKVWLPPLTRGIYDLVIDENQNGIFDGID